MVIQSAEIAAEFFKNYDLSFIDPALIDTMKAIDFHKGSMALAPYGVYWRLMRRICMVELFANKRINGTAFVRRKCVDSMLSWIEKEANKAESMNGISVTRYVFLASFNTIGNLTLSRDLVDPESKEVSEFFDAMMGVTKWGGYPNISDLFPWLRVFDLQGLRKKMSRDMGKAFEIVSRYVEERIEDRKSCRETRKDFLEALLDFEGSKNEPPKLSEWEIKIFILEIFLGGSETTSSSVEWAMTELLRNPEKMAKVKNEISSIVGSKKKLEESDIDKLPYLQAVGKETLRLHPPTTFLLPRKTMKDTNFMGYSIPKNTQVFVNVWAIGRDEKCWEEPLCFKPERFLDSNIDYKGQNFEFIPFGAGRRICPGLPLAHRMMNFVLSSLLRNFDWELEASTAPNSIDTTDKIGFIVRKLVPLKAIPKKRVY